MSANHLNYNEGDIMSTSIYEDILGSNRLRTEKYINDTILLTKSIIVKNEQEEDTYNKVLEMTYPSYTPPEDKHLWRYYHHLSGVPLPYAQDPALPDTYVTVLNRDELYELTSSEVASGDCVKVSSTNELRVILSLPITASNKDTNAPIIPAILIDEDMIVRSVDTGRDIVLSKEILEDHSLTRKEIHKYDAYYNEIVKKYPRQELLLRSMANLTEHSAEDIVKMEDFSILSYNSSLVEVNEDNLIYELDRRIQNYKVQNLITNYRHTDNLFLAGQYINLYNYMVTTILSLRLENVKTPRVHSYHLFNYLSSHHRLDNEYDYLTLYQKLYLYRNILYINNHSGLNSTLVELVEKLYRERGMSLSTYEYQQLNEITEEGHPDYSFKKREIRETKTPLSKETYSLDDIINKEIRAYPQNKGYYDLYRNSIKDRFDYSLYSNIKTKNLESIFLNESSSVKYPLIDVVIDSMFHTAGLDKLKPLIPFTNKASSIEYNVPVEDALKLFSMVTYLLMDINLLDPASYESGVEAHFPDYLCKRVLRQPNELHPASFYIDKMIKPEIGLREVIQSVIDNSFEIPIINSTEGFKDHVSKTYLIELAYWLFETNESALWTNGNLRWFFPNVHKEYLYEFDDEKPDEFMTRIGIYDLDRYDRKALTDLMLAIINGFTYNLLEEMATIVDIQKALTRIFNRFKSYTVRVVSDQVSNDSYVLGHGDVRCQMNSIGAMYYIEPHRVDIYIENEYIINPSTQEEMEWLIFNL